MNRSIIVAVTAVALASCATSGPKQAANFVSQVEESRETLQATKEEIQRALVAVNALRRIKGGDLQAQYAAINSAVIQSGKKMIRFRKKFASMDKTSESFFSGWAAELDEYTTAEFRKRSEARLKKPVTATIGSGLACRRLKRNLSASGRSCTTSCST